VHGRSVTGTADVNMAQMQMSLLAEQEEQLGAGRGLLPNSDGQCFQILLSQSLVQQLTRLRSHLMQPSHDRKRSIPQAPGLVPGRMSSISAHQISARMRQSWQAYFALNQLLSGFLTHLYDAQHEYVVRNRTVIEQLLDAEFPVDAADEQKTLFYTGKGRLCRQRTLITNDFVDSIDSDQSYSFRKLTLGGVECDLLLFELGLFTLIDVISFDQVFASLITFLVSNVSVIQGQITCCLVLCC
jgi:meckelin